jgi:hypothetical protein
VRSSRTACSGGFIDEYREGSVLGFEEDEVEGDVCPRIVVMRSRGMLLVVESMLGASLLAGPSPLSAQDQPAAWSTPDQLRTWIHGDPTVTVTTLTEPGRTFVRISSPGSMYFGIPNILAEQPGSYHSAPTLVNLQYFNAVKVVLRHTMPFGLFSGFWRHRHGDYPGDR